MTQYIENMEREWSEDSDPDGIRKALILREADPEASLQLLKELADRGSSLAMLYLGDIYANGRGVDRNTKLGVEWYRNAAENGSIEAAHHLAFCYYYMGKIEESLEILREISDKGFTPATYCLALYYLNGVGVDKSLESAIKFLKIAENRGHLLSARHLSFILRSGVCGLPGRIRGYLKMIAIIIPSIRCALNNPRSERLRKW